MTAQEKTAYFLAEPCFSDVRGQEAAKRALLIAAAGGHNVLMVGAPGSGMTMLARRLPGILPPLSRQQALEVDRTYRAAGLAEVGGRPFRAPHCSTSHAGLFGGRIGRLKMRPGEVALAAHGVLFLDALPEFSRPSMDALALQPDRYMLVTAMNPCPCGYLTSRKRLCRCSPEEVHRYQGRVSGPLLDRIDIRIEVEPLEARDLHTAARGETSEELRGRVVDARRCQAARSCQLNGLLREAQDELHLSSLACDQIRRVALTIADLDGLDRPGEDQVLEALRYRAL